MERLLDIPEVLAHIASFIPVFKGPPDAPTFVPHDLLACTLVCHSWREAMLPYLWAAYTPNGMEAIPADTLSQNSIFFRRIDQGKFEQHLNVARQLWEEASGNPLLRCTTLKSFSLTSKSLTKQLDLLRVNHDLASLEWWFFQTQALPGTIRDAVEPFASSLKELSLQYGTYSRQDLSLLLNSFPTLEHFHVNVPIAPLFDNTTATSETLSGQSGPVTSAPDAVRVHTLKRLSFHEKLLFQSRVTWFLETFNHCPIEHVKLEVDNAMTPHRGRSTLDPLQEIYESVLAWRSRVGASLLEAEDSVLYVCPQKAYQGVKRLDIWLGEEDEATGTRCHAQYERDCQSLTVLTAQISSSDSQVVVPLIHSFKHTLREVDLEVRSYLREYNAYEILSQLLGTLVGLQSLKYVALAGLSSRHSLAVFKSLDYGGGYDAALPFASPAGSGWVCQHLETLSIQGLWAARSIDKPDAGQDAITLQACSEKHHWVANNATAFGKQLREAISHRIKTLADLRKLTLGNAYFAYSEIHLQSSDSTQQPNTNQ